MMNAICTTVTNHLGHEGLFLSNNNLMRILPIEKKFTINN